MAAKGRKTTPKKTTQKKTAPSRGSKKETPPAANAPAADAPEIGLNREGMVALANYLDEFLMLNPTICGRSTDEQGNVLAEGVEISTISDDDLKARLNEAAGILEPGDFYPAKPEDPKVSEEGIELLQALGYNIPEDPSAQKASKGKGKGGAGKGKKESKAVAKSVYGHRQGTTAETMDNYVAGRIAEGAKSISVEAMEKSTGFKAGKLRTHLKYLLKKVPELKFEIEK